MIPILLILVLGLVSLFVGLTRGITRRVPLLCNEAAAPNYKKMHAEAVGISPDASDKDAAAAHVKHMQAVGKELDNDDEDDDDDIDNENPKKKSPAANAATTADELVVNARAETAELLLNQALEKGRIVAATVPAWKEKFAADFDGTKTLLANEKTPVIKVTPKTGALGGRSGDIVTNEADRRDELELAVNETMEKRKLNYTDAFIAVKGNKKYAHLFVGHAADKK